LVSALADLGVDEVAAVLGVPTGTVKSRLSRARAALAERLDGYRTDANTDRRTGAGADRRNPVDHNGDASTTEVAHA
jgi:hypothetical protein